MRKPNHIHKSRARHIRKAGYHDGCAMREAGCCWIDFANPRAPLPCYELGRRARLEWGHYFDGLERGLFGYPEPV